MHPRRRGEGRTTRRGSHFRHHTEEGLVQAAGASGFVWRVCTRVTRTCTTHSVLHPDKFHTLSHPRRLSTFPQTQNRLREVPKHTLHPAMDAKHTPSGTHTDSTAFHTNMHHTLPHPPNTTSSIIFRNTHYMASTRADQDATTHTRTHTPGRDLSATLLCCAYL